MKKRILGRTAIQVSEVAFGGVEIGMPYGIGVNSAADMVSENEAIRLLHASTDAGINFFDTARLYGNSETIMGKAFAGRRKDVVISTKCRGFRDKQGNLPPDNEIKKIIEISVSESLLALQTDYVDVFMLHQADEEILENQAIAKAFTDLEKRGITRAIGASTYTTNETEKAISSGLWDVLQVPYNLMDQRQSELFDEAKQRGIGIVIRSVLLKGLLSDRGKELHPALQDVQQHIQRYDDLLGADFADLPTLAIKFALSSEQVAAVLIGMDRMEYLRQALIIADGLYMHPDGLKRAQGLAYPDPAFLNLPHWDKMGWLK
ncbi:aldo/keto reductase [Chitinophaga sp. MM2321]|uniref:aldo/keto reductase n=1 Tax=Chitinophaga sp. MM2321 TaxID=3137178 RepID=UPI0032D58707